MKIIEGNIIDIFQREIYPGEIFIEKGIIKSISRNTKIYNSFILPGFIDAHVHIESSMLTSKHFSELVISKGTVGVINDPHEIANVLGIKGINFMIEDSHKAAIKTFFTIPSCVPSTPFDSSGSEISSIDTEKLAKTGNFIGISEMMNVPGVLYKDPEVTQKLIIGRNNNLKIDGHAPGLKGEDLLYYINCGISTDHECVSIEEAKEKIAGGMKILIREGSAAKNYEALKSLIKSNPDDVMFCTDDSHPDELISEGHIDKIVKRALMDGFDLFDVLKIASINPVKHYKIDIGTLKLGDSADFIKIENLESFKVLSTYIAGIEKYNSDQIEGKEGDNTLKSTFIDNEDEAIEINNFNCSPITLIDIEKSVKNKITCIKVENGEIVTSKQVFKTLQSQNNFEADIDRDILKIVYLNRYKESKPQVAFIHGVQLKEGAFATSISHDSHNIIAIGCSDQNIVNAINAIIDQKGGLAVTKEGKTDILSLPIAGIMTNEPGKKVAEDYKKLNKEIREMGCILDSPFMTLSFMSLIVIPELKIGEKGLFDFNSFSFIEEE